MLEAEAPILAKGGAVCLYFVLMSPSGLATAALNFKDLLKDNGGFCAASSRCRMQPAPTGSLGLSAGLGGTAIVLK